MAWDDIKSVAGTLTAVEWNEHVNDQKLRPKEGAHSYFIFIDGVTYKARNGTTGIIDYSGADFKINVFQPVCNAITAGGIIHITDGSYTLTQQPWVGYGGGHQEIHCSPGAIITASAGFTGAMIRLKGDYCSWHGGQIVGDGNVSGNYGFLIDGNNHCKIEDVYYNKLSVFVYLNNSDATSILFPRPGADVGQETDNSYRIISDPGFDNNLVMMSDVENAYRGKIDITESEPNSPPTGVGIRIENRGFGDAIFIDNLNPASGKVLSGSNGKAIVIDDYGIDYSVVMQRRVAATYALFRLVHLHADDTSPFVDFTDGAIGQMFSIGHNGEINTNIPQTTLNGTTAGSLIHSMPFKGASYKKFIGYLNGYDNNTGSSQTVTFPTAFSQIPKLVINDAAGATVSTTTLTLPNSIGTPLTGWIIIEGY